MHLSHGDNFWFQSCFRVGDSQLNLITLIGVHALARISSGNKPVETRLSSRFVSLIFFLPSLLTFTRENKEEPAERARKSDCQPGLARTPPGH